ncbi:MAG: hypothetical protein OEW11_03605 [Nitrospirota bacterium]|nr:hypothetical protein [Nitrospirota bacterium]
MNTPTPPGPPTPPTPPVSPPPGAPPPERPASGPSSDPSGAHLPSGASPAEAPTAETPPTAWQKLAPWLWRPVYLLLLYASFLFFLEHSLGHDPLGKGVLVAVLLLGVAAVALGLRPPAWAPPAGLKRTRNLMVGVLLAFLVVNAILSGATQAAFERENQLRTVLKEVLYEYGMYPISLEELGELAGMEIPPAITGTHPRPFRYQRLGEKGDRYVLRFDAARFNICSRADNDWVWQCDMRGSLPPPSDIPPER